jgi:hypothetical protein
MIIPKAILEGFKKVFESKRFDTIMFRYPEQLAQLAEELGRDWTADWIRLHPKQVSTIYLGLM